MRKLSARTKKVFVGLIGILVVLIGLALVPLPGPGWLVVFLGLALLGTEFDWAKRIHDWGREKFEAWERWMRAQPRSVQVLFGTFAIAILVLVLWLINSFGFIDHFFNLHMDWLHSPFFPGIGNK